jgi:hypothetical protein
MNFTSNTIRSLTFMNALNPRDLRDLSIKLPGMPAFLGLALPLDASSLLVKAFGVARAPRPIQSSLQVPLMKPGFSGLFEGFLISEPYQAGGPLTREGED